jgi:hypothetical protein
LKRKQIKKTYGKTARSHSLTKAIKENNELLKEVLEQLYSNNHNSNTKSNNYRPMSRKQQNPLDEIEEL